MYGINSNKIILIVPFIFLVFQFSCSEEKDKSKRPSPPRSDTSLIGTTKVVIDYSSPAVKKRKLLGGLIPLNRIWRTGANEATVFETHGNLLIMGKPLPKGKYSYFTIATEKGWNIVFNKVWDQWGAMEYSESNDALRVSVLPYQSDKFQERMKLYFDNSQLVFHWGNWQYSLELEEI